MTERLTHRELRNHSSEVLRAVQSGATYEVTNYGEVVAVLSPPQRRASDQLRVRAATQRGGFADLLRVTRDRPARDVLDELRAGR